MALLKLKASYRICAKIWGTCAKFDKIMAREIIICAEVSRGITTAVKELIFSVPLE